MNLTKKEEVSKVAIKLICPFCGHDGFYLDDNKITCAKCKKLVDTYGVRHSFPIRRSDGR